MQYMSTKAVMVPKWMVYSTFLEHEHIMDKKKYDLPKERTTKLLHSRLNCNISWLCGAFQLNNFSMSEMTRNMPVTTGIVQLCRVAIYASPLVFLFMFGSLKVSFTCRQSPLQPSQSHRNSKKDVWGIPTIFSAVMTAQNITSACFQNGRNCHMLLTHTDMTLINNESWETWRKRISISRCN